MMLAIVLLQRVSVQEFQTTAREAIAAVIESDRD
jgi:hypothetical protein